MSPSSCDPPASDFCFKAAVSAPFCSDFLQFLAISASNFLQLRRSSSRLPFLLLLLLISEMAEKRTQLIWNDETVNKRFLQECIQEVTNNGREGNSLKAASWMAIMEKLKNEHNFIANHKQLRNRYDYLKSKYTAFVILKSKTGNFYNPVTNTFNMSEEEWQYAHKLHKYVEKLRHAPLCFPDLCSKLFDGLISIGFQSWGPSSTQPRIVEEVTMHDSDDTPIDTPMDTPIDTPIDMPIDTPITQKHVGGSEDSTSHSKMNTKNLKRKDHKGKEIGVNIMDSKLLDVGDAIMNVSKSLIEKHAIDNDMDACMEKLEKLGWDEFDAKYETALLLFGESADIRKVWLRIKPTSCESWVKNAKRKYGLFG